MHSFFYNIFENISECYRGNNLVWQLVLILLTFIFVITGFDWFYYQSTRGVELQSFLFPAVYLGILIPTVVIIALFLYGVITKNKRVLNTMWALLQAGMLGLGISSLYKVFTGRMGPMHSLISTTSIDISHMFRFGFLRGGAFQGWPSSHTATAFAMSLALFTLYPENKFIRFCAILYALYIGIGVSTNIHWFSDFVAGAILGTIIGISVGKSFLKRYNEHYV